jgi:hypothetical protein
LSTACRWNTASRTASLRRIRIPDELKGIDFRHYKEAFLKPGEACIITHQFVIIE